MRRKPLMIDLCCGRGGWTKGFMAAGFRCIGYDIKEQPDYPGTFRRRDLLKLNCLDLMRADFICVSTPCEQFSVHTQPHFHPNPKHPETGIQLFEHARKLCIQSGRPFLMENVRGAQEFIGQAVQHCGPFYFWGNAVPAIFPRELYAITKGLAQGNAEFLARNILKHRNESKQQRKKRVAVIPFSLSFYIANIARNAFVPDFPTMRHAATPAIETANA